MTPRSGTHGQFTAPYQVCLLALHALPFTMALFLALTFGFEYMPSNFFFSGRVLYPRSIDLHLAVRGVPSSWVSSVRVFVKLLVSELIIEDSPPVASRENLNSPFAPPSVAWFAISRRTTKFPC